MAWSKKFTVTGSCCCNDLDPCDTCTEWSEWEPSPPAPICYFTQPVTQTRTCPDEGKEECEQTREILVDPIDPELPNYSELCPGVGVQLTWECVSYSGTANLCGISGYSSDAAPYDAGSPATWEGQYRKWRKRDLAGSIQISNNVCAS